MKKTGIRIVFNRLLNGWYVVRGAHQTPIGGRFETRDAALEYLGRKAAAEYARRYGEPLQARMLRDLTKHQEIGSGA